MTSNSPQRRGRNRAVTLIDIVMVIFIICMLGGWLFSAGGLMRARESANRVKCGSNLRQVGQAILLYANENKGNYPRTGFTPGEAWTQYTGVECKNPFGKDGVPKANDVTAAMFLLVRTQDITTEVFVCPSTDLEKFKFVKEGNTAQDCANFASEANLSYSMANPYPDMKAIANGYKVNQTVGAEFAVAADMNPGTFGESDVTPAKGPADDKAAAALMQKANSMNHRGMGQNVLFGDGHVDWTQHPFVGVKNDNIYTVSGANDSTKTTSDKIVGSPMWAGDSVLLPVATANPHKKTPEQEELAALAEFKAQLPRIKEMMAKEEKADPGSARLQEMKKFVEMMEKEAAETEAKIKK